MQLSGQGGKMDVGWNIYFLCEAQNAAEHALIWDCVLRPGILIRMMLLVLQVGCSVDLC